MNARTNINEKLRQMYSKLLNFKETEIGRKEQKSR